MKKTYIIPSMQETKLETSHCMMQQWSNESGKDNLHQEGAGGDGLSRRRGGWFDDED